MELIDYWQLLTRRLWLILLVIALSLGAALLYSRAQGPAYTATATLLLNPRADNPLAQYQSVESGDLAVLYADYIRSEAFRTELAAELGGAVTPELAGAALSTRFIPDSQYFTISGAHPDPQLAEALANGAADLFVRRNNYRVQRQSQQFDEVEGPIDPLDEQLLLEQQLVIEEELRYLEGKIADLQAELSALQGLRRTERTSERIQALLEEIFRLRSVRADLMVSLPTRLLEPAGPARAASTGLAGLLLQALAAGLVAGLGLAFLAETLDTRVRSVRELERLYGMPAQGSVRATRAGRQGGPPPGDLGAPDEALDRDLRGVLLALSLDGYGEGRRSLLVTSAAQDEGKSFIALQLAAGMARAGRRVLLVDAHLRRPALSAALGAGGAKGLADLLRGAEGGAAGLVQPTALAGLALLPCGTPAARAAADGLLPSLGALMAELAGEADLVIYDGPPVGPLSEGLQFAAHTDGALQVVRAGRTGAGAIIGCKEALERAGSPLLGPVLNAVRPTLFGGGPGRRPRPQGRGEAPLAVQQSVSQNR